MNFGKNLLKYANSMNITVQKELAKKLKESEKTISSYTNERSYPTYKKLVKLCNLLKCDPNTLMEGDFESNITINTPQLPPEDQYIIDRYKSLTPHDREIVDHIFKMKPEEPTIIYRFPVYEQQAAAGAGITGRDGKFTMQNIMTSDIPQNAVFGVRIKGTSMINTDPKLIIEDIPDNSFVLLNPRVSVSDLNKTIVVASINNEVICKYFLEEQNCVHFYSLNRTEHADDDRFAKSPNDYKIIGQVVKIIKPNEHE